MMASKISNHNTQGQTFWTSYADLMTSLFFLMLALYAVTFVVLKAEQARYKADAEQLRKIREIEKALNSIADKSGYFAYSEEFKKHILTIEVKFDRGSSNINDIDEEKRFQLKEAGRIISQKIDSISRQERDIKYLLIIEGQASRDLNSGHEYSNYVLSYNRALSLLRFWKESGIAVAKGDLKNCELLVAGSGEYGTPRDSENVKNQRFLIHILPKTGVIHQNQKLQ